VERSLALHADGASKTFHHADECRGEVAGTALSFHVLRRLVEGQQLSGCLFKSAGRLVIIYAVNRDEARIVS
jgi:hypothetical protein